MFLNEVVMKLIVPLAMEVFVTGIVYRFLSFAKLGTLVELVHLSVVITVFLFSAYFSVKAFACMDSEEFKFFCPSVQRFVLAKQVFCSLIPCFVYVTIFAIVFFLALRWDISASFMVVVKVFLIFLIYVLVGASVGLFGWAVFGHEVLATLFSIVVWSLLIGSCFSLVLIERYVEDLRFYIPVFLHINPLIAVCHVLEYDIFRTPKLYELTPISSYLFVYPKWYLICGWQVLIGIFCSVIILRFKLSHKMV